MHKIIQHCKTFILFCLLWPLFGKAQIISIPREDTMIVSGNYYDGELGILIENNTADTLYFPGLRVMYPQYPQQGIFERPLTLRITNGRRHLAKRNFANLDSIGLSSYPFSLVMVMQSANSDSLIQYRPAIYRIDYIGHEVRPLNDSVMYNKLGFKSAWDLFYYTHSLVLPPDSQMYWNIICDFRPFQLENNHCYKLIFYYNIFSLGWDYLENKDMIRKIPERSLQTKPIIVKYLE